MDMATIEDTIRTLYVENKYKELLLLKDELVTLCNYDKEKASLFLPLLITSHVGQMHPDEIGTEERIALYNDFMYIMRNVPVTSIPPRIISET